jgi:hypothetical protein
MLIMATVTNTSPFGSGVIAASSVANPIAKFIYVKMVSVPASTLRGAGAGAVPVRVLGTMELG